jgi:hypothetical protein
MSESDVFGVNYDERSDDCDDIDVSQRLTSFDRKNGSGDFELTIQKVVILKFERIRI